jgi:AhpD family alkylhydroperoxidase
MKYITIFFLLISTIAMSQSNDQAYQELLEQNPFNKMYPKAIAQDAADYFSEWNKLFSEGPIATKEARLVAISASAAMRCEYCITAQVHLAKQAGATDDEIKAAIQIAAEVARFSTLLYGNEFSMEELNKIIGKE